MLSLETTRPQTAIRLRLHAYICLLERFYEINLGSHFKKQKTLFYEFN